MKKIFISFLVICLCFSSSGCSEQMSRTYEAAVEDYMDVYICGETDKLQKLAPPAAFEHLKEKKGYDIENYKEIIEEEAADRWEVLEPKYGKDHRFTVTVHSKEPLDAWFLKNIKQMMPVRYSIPADEVKEVAVAHFTATFSGNGNEKKQELKMSVVKIGDAWYACDNSGTLGITNSQLFY